MWTSLFNCAAHANDVLRNDLRWCEVISEFIFDTHTYCFNLLICGYIGAYCEPLSCFCSAQVRKKLKWV